MKALSYPEDVRGVLSFDFDGTLFIEGADPPLDLEFFDRIKQLRSEGWIWGINTGRTLMYMLQGFSDAKFPFLPDFVVAREREIYTPAEYGRWVPVLEWQKKCHKAHKKLTRQAKHFFREVHAYVIAETKAKWVPLDGELSELIATSEEEIERVVEFIEKHRGLCPWLGYQRNSIYLRFSHVDYHKGTSLGELSRLAGVSSDRVFAIGDSHNDLDKLDPMFTGLMACVGNAEQVVKDHVAGHGGYVAAGLGSVGTVEALDHYFHNGR